MRAPRSGKFKKKGKFDRMSGKKKGWGAKKRREGPGTPQGGCCPLVVMPSHIITPKQPGGVRKMGRLAWKTPEVKNGIKICRSSKEGFGGGKVKTELRPEGTPCLKPNTARGRRWRAEKVVFNGRRAKEK